MFAQSLSQKSERSPASILHTGWLVYIMEPWGDCVSCSIAIIHNLHKPRPRELLHHALFLLDAALLLYAAKLPLACTHMLWVCVEHHHCPAMQRHLNNFALACSPCITRVYPSGAPHQFNCRLRQPLATWHIWWIELQATARWTHFERSTRQH